MSHGPNRYRAERRIAEMAADRSGAGPDAVERARRVIAAWNERAQRGKPAEFFPTFETALTAGCWRLTYCCPACRQVGAVDIRDFADAHHPRAPISMLIPKLSCDRCCPNPPLAVLLDLGLRSVEFLPAVSDPVELPRQAATQGFTLPIPPIPTIGELQKEEPHWVWFYCGAIDCTYSQAIALAPFVIRWGPDASSDRLRRSLRCTKCDHKGGTIMVASLISFSEGHEPFPVDGKRYVGRSFTGTWGMMPPGRKKFD